MRDAPIRVLLIEDNAGDRRLTQEMLRDGGRPFECVIAERLSEAIDLLADKTIEAILLDLSLPDGRGLDALSRVRARAPHLPILILTGMDDEGLARQAVRDGAQEYLVKGELLSKTLIRSLHNSVERNRAQRQLSQPNPGARGRILTVIGAKGAVGTSTVALNIAAALMRWQARVIAVEWRHYSGTLALETRQAPSKTLRTLLCPGAVGELRPLEHLTRLPFGLEVLFGPQPGEIIDEISPEQTEACLGDLAGAADSVVVDLPSCPSPATRAALKKSHCTIVVGEPEPLSMECAKAIIESCQDYRPRYTGVVVVNKGTLSAPPSLNEMRARFCCPVLGSVPPAADACLASQKTGIPLVISQAASLPAIKLAEIAQGFAGERVFPLEFR
jgi:CheY-like chemotaxis protein/MinD-like ATPase involved in chromosome partitioning or flagellar assembly